MIVRGLCIALVCGGVLLGRPAEARAPVIPILAGALAMVSCLKGAVEVLELGARAWRALKSMDELRKGDQVRTKNEAKVEITLFDASVVRLDGDSSLALDDLSKDKPGLWGRVRLLLGGLWARLSRKGKHDGFEVTSKGARVKPQGTTYGMAARDPGNCKLSVYDGSVLVYKPRAEGGTSIGSLRPKEVSRTEWTRAVERGQYIEWNDRAEVVQSGATAQPAAGAEAEWLAWNRERDSILESHGIEGLLAPPAPSPVAAEPPEAAARAAPVAPEGEPTVAAEEVGPPSEASPANAATPAASPAGSPPPR